MALKTKGVPKYILIGLLQEALTECSTENSIAKHVALKIATTYLDNTALLEELKTSPDLPNNIHGLLEIAIRTYREPLNAVAECLLWIRQAETPNSVLSRILHVIQKSPINFPTEATQIMLAKEAIKEKMEYLSAQTAFDNAYPDLRAQNFSGERGWYTWMKEDR